ncbi:uncharacterized protein BDR25DRAFT_356536 [Lindgomyces ingoldianus]|uniref:Uncharacterized protein n=1 Tax=Lindgomyces ingoldianus TaxID=673940 RepID=A0ACB6QQL4_9PLEO|nr:uncharacterized protein BDR25DRAFT_356536 [Lindgomyces ingoldianus]KAF2469293.1 hypothetical protein BDR25DRAFT_356536 [Lindgomyces ingoldianus]
MRPQLNYSMSFVLLQVGAILVCFSVVCSKRTQMSRSASTTRNYCREIRAKADGIHGNKVSETRLRPGAVHDAKVRSTIRLIRRLPSPPCSSKSWMSFTNPKKHNLFDTSSGQRTLAHQSFLSRLPLYPSRLVIGTAHLQSLPSHTFVQGTPTGGSALRRSQLKLHHRASRLIRLQQILSKIEPSRIQNSNTPLLYIRSPNFNINFDIMFSCVNYERGCRGRCNTQNGRCDSCITLNLQGIRTNSSSSFSSVNGATYSAMTSSFASLSQLAAASGKEPRYDTKGYDSRSDFSDGVGYFDSASIVHQLLQIDRQIHGSIRRTFYSIYTGWALGMVDGVMVIEPTFFCQVSINTHEQYRTAFPSTWGKQAFLSFHQIKPRANANIPHVLYPADFAFCTCHTDDQCYTVNVKRTRSPCSPLAISLGSTPQALGCHHTKGALIYPSRYLNDAFFYTPANHPYASLLHVRHHRIRKIPSQPRFFSGLAATDQTRKTKSIDLLAGDRPKRMDEATGVIATLAPAARLYREAGRGGGQLSKVALHEETRMQWASFLSGVTRPSALSSINTCRLSPSRQVRYPFVSDTATLQEEKLMKRAFQKRRILSSKFRFSLVIIPMQLDEITISNISAPLGYQFSDRLSQTHLAASRLFPSLWECVVTPQSTFAPSGRRPAAPALQPHEIGAVYVVKINDVISIRVREAIRPVPKGIRTSHTTSLQTVVTFDHREYGRHLQRSKRCDLRAYSRMNGSISVGIIAKFVVQLGGCVCSNERLQRVTNNNKLRSHISSTAYTSRNIRRRETEVASNFRVSKLSTSQTKVKGGMKDSSGIGFGATLLLPSLFECSEVLLVSPLSQEVLSFYLRAMSYYRWISSLYLAFLYQGMLPISRSETRRLRPILSINYQIFFCQIRINGLPIAPFVLFGPPKGAPGSGEQVSQGRLCRSPREEKTFIDEKMIELSSKVYGAGWQTKTAIRRQNIERGLEFQRAMENLPKLTLSNDRKEKMKTQITHLHFKIRAPSLAVLMEYSLFPENQRPSIGNEQTSCNSPWRLPSNKAPFHMTLSPLSFQQRSIIHSTMGKRLSFGIIDYITRRDSGRTS